MELAAPGLQAFDRGKVNCGVEGTCWDSEESVISRRGVWLEAGNDRGLPY